MNNKRVVKILIFIICCMFVLQVLATKFYWYYTIWYFDMPMHIVGGFWSGLLLILILSYKKQLGGSPAKQIWKILGGVLLIGVSWEIFEFSVNNFLIRNLFVANTLDSFSDIFFDLMGGSLALIYFFKNIMLVEHNEHGRESN